MICLVYAAECARGIRNGILFCIQVLVPSLFLLMVLSAYLIQSGRMQALTRPLNELSRWIFRLPSPALAVILLAAIGGYPVGARCAALSCQNGSLTEEEARKTALIAVGAGPGFLINFVGRGLLGSPDAGILLLLSQIVGLLTTGIIIGRVIPCRTSQTQRPIKAPQGGLLIASVGDASRATFHMCAMVVLCSAVIEVITAVSPNQTLTDLSAAAIEITSGCGMLCGRYPLALIAFFIGFGGLSVHLQIYAALGDLAIKKHLFFLFRIIQGILTAGATYLLLVIFPIEISVFNSADIPLTAAKSATLIGSAALVLSALSFLAAVRKNNLRRS